MKTELLKLKPNAEVLTTNDLKNVFGGRGNAGPAGSDVGDPKSGGATCEGACCCGCRP